jgi:hypothetical protein
VSIAPTLHLVLAVQVSGWQARTPITTDLSFWILPTCLAEFAEHGLHCKFHQHLVLTTLTCIKSWMVRPSWPTNGEIEVTEGVNSASSDSMTLHTNAGCSISNYDTPYSSTLMTSNCDVNAPGQATNAGCLVESPSSQTFGNGFNAIGGGVYATEWTSTAISIYFFPRSAIPADITTGNPDPRGWGEPQAIFSGGCDIDSHLVDQKIVSCLFSIPNIAADNLPSRSSIRHFVATGQVMYGVPMQCALRLHQRTKHTFEITLPLS